ncbi:efflux RND transporter periplasmic adaptor subunit [Alkalimonas sp. MEB108]|uniref:Efflux RND transporter periplasmic adaptor subunit n=1 Tax=Alkalimonas cellulosilytica TaxID=3058395 RepID=A0ABU7J6M5_9GAMM|nr:efflux RND transporter periplasmic adaptor subunit [Alkalimonas sp. MEB108]MEE2002170.1 efflux RND transporter periplasmic adaptor subunit [Alkalimonas sp. MEB108]
MKQLFVFLVSAAICLLLPACQSEAPANADTQRQSIRATGQLFAAGSQQISPPSVSRMWQYNIQQMAPESSLVSAGDMVVAFDGQTLMEQLRNKQMELSSLRQEQSNQLQQDEERHEELKLELAERLMDYQRFQRRAEIVDHSRSANEREKARIDYTIAANQHTLAQSRLEFHQQQRQVEAQLLQSRVSRLQSEINQLQQELASMQVKAPFDGMVIYLPNFQGEKSAVGDTVQFGHPVAAVSQLDTLKIRAELDEVDIRFVRPGLRVQITLDAYPERSFSGLVEELSPSVRNKSNQQLNRVVDATISFDDLDTSIMRPGMTARLTIQLSRREAS